MSGGTISGIAAGTVIALLVLGMLIWFFRRRRRIRSSSGYIYNAVHPDIDDVSYSIEPFSEAPPPSSECLQQHTYFYYIEHAIRLQQSQPRITSPTIGAIILWYQFHLTQPSWLPAAPRKAEYHSRTATIARCQIRRLRLRQSCHPLRCWRRPQIY
jgi:hypothetical protein